MSWQDAVFGSGQLAFTLALLPSLLGPDKPAARTSAMTAAILFTFAFTYASLGLGVAAIACAVCGMAWCVLFSQKLTGTRWGL